MNSFEEEQSLLLSLYPSEPSSSYYHIDLLQYHLAKCSFSLAVQKYNQGSISLSQDLLQQAYQYISYTEKVSLSLSVFINSLILIVKLFLNSKRPFFINLL